MKGGFESDDLRTSLKGSRAAMIEGLSLNVGLVALLVVLGWAVQGACYIFVGATRMEKSTKYGTFEVVWGIGELIFVLWVLLA